MKLINKSLLHIDDCVNSIFNARDKSQLLLIDSFISSSFNDIKIINKLYSNLQNVVCLKHKSFFKKNIHFNNNSFKFLNKITSGSYGNINKCLFNNKQAIFKNIKFKHAELKNSSLIYLLNNEFFKENIIHLIIFCLIQSIPTYIPNCIPQVYNIFNATNNHDNFETVIIVMEKLDLDLFSFFEKKHSFSDELNIIALIAFNLYNIQKCFKFMHRDLHSGNIMIKKLSEPITTNIVTNKSSFSVSSNFQTYLIDFGMAYIDFDSKCSNIKMKKSHVFVEGSYTNNKTYNKCQDLRLLLASIYFWHNKNLSKQFKSFLKPLFTPYQKFINFDKPTFFFYNDVIHIKDTNFYPQNLLEHIQEHI